MGPAATRTEPAAPRTEPAAARTQVRLPRLLHSVLRHLHLRHRRTLKDPPSPPPIGVPERGPCAFSGHGWLLRAALHSSDGMLSGRTTGLPEMFEPAASKVDDSAAACLLQSSEFRVYSSLHPAFCRHGPRPRLPAGAPLPRRPRRDQRGRTGCAGGATRHRRQGRRGDGQRRQRGGQRGLMLASRWWRERGLSTMVGPEAEATQAAQQMCKRRLARRSRYGELRGGSRSDEARGGNGLRERGTSRQSK